MAASVESLTPGELQSLLDGPAVAPPAGSISSLENPPNIDTVCYLTSYLCVSCARHLGSCHAYLHQAFFNPPFCL